MVLLRLSQELRGRVLVVGVWSSVAFYLPHHTPHAYPRFSSYFFFFLVRAGVLGARVRRHPGRDRQDARGGGAHLPVQVQGRSSQEGPVVGLHRQLLLHDGL